MRLNLKTLGVTSYEEAVARYGSTVFGLAKELMSTLEKRIFWSTSSLQERTLMVNMIFDLNNENSVKFLFF